ncbi:MAG: tripartite tricarboxylate transporter substrate-binding protein [Beijerinckiaceae bacterium]|nr:tripartite tricarboxylate transporter substrate-binding protein [Beijerinckiaceae bacterium]
MTKSSFLATKRTLLACAAGLAFGALAAAPAQSQTDEAAFYKGKNIRVIVGFSPGGGYDAYARMMAPYLGQRLGANIVVENMPGAGSMTAMNALYAAEADGLRMMLANGTAAGLSQIMDSPAARFDLANYSHLGTVSASPWVWLVHKDTPEKTPADFIKSGRLINWSATGPIDGLSDGAQITCAITKLNCKIVMGYKGSNDAGLAITRKEMDAVFVSDTSANNYVRSNDLHAVANMSRTRSRFFPDVPTIYEAVKLTPDDEWLMDFHGTVQDLGRILIAPPNMAPARLAYLRAMIKDTLADPKLRSEGEKTQRYIDFIDADKTMQNVRRAISDITPAQKKRVQMILSAK